MTKLTLDSERAIRLVNGEPDPEYTYVDSEYDGQWRWGVSYEVIIKDQEGKFWGVVYQEQIGDHYYTSLEDGKTVTFYPYEAFEVTKTEYRKVKQ